MAAGRAMAKLALNLSCIWQPWPLQAAMVVSEMKERLSPNMAPPMTVAMHRGTEYPEAAATDRAMGVMRVMVPTLVPMARETKQLMTKRTPTASLAGKMDRRNQATLSALDRPTVPTKMPAARKMRIMMMMFLSPTPSPMRTSLSSKESLRFWRQATSRAARKQTTMGML